MSVFRLKWLGLLLILLPLSIFSQRFPFTNISVKDGLPQSSVFRIVQDKQGYIWMATEAGLCRFDGYKFVTYSIHNGLGSKFVSDIKFDPKGNLWVSTMGKGISWFDGKKFNRIDKSNGLPSNQIRSLEFTDNGELFISTLDTGIVRLKKNTVPYIYKLPDGSEFNNPWRLIKLRNGDILGVGSFGAAIFQKSNGYNYKIICESNPTLLNAYEDIHGDIWIGGVNQLVQISKNKITDHSHLLFTLDGTSLNVWDIYEPSDTSALYISTSKGIMILKNNTVKWLTTSNGLPYENIRDTYQDGYGNFWVGTYGGGAAILDSKGLDHFDYSNDILPLSTYGIVEDYDGTIWMGSENHGVFRYDGSMVYHEQDPRLKTNLVVLGMGLNPVTHEVWMGGLYGQIIKLKDGKIIYYRNSKPDESLPFLYVNFLPDGTGIFCSQKGVYRMGIEDNNPHLITEIPQVYIRSCFLDKEGYMWFLADEGDVYKWKDGKLTNLTAIINSEYSGMDHGLYDAKHDIYWFCSNTGLIAWNNKGRYLFHSGNGLKSDSPWSITQDSIGRIWVGHEKGVECIDVDNHKITFIGYDQGFTPVETNSCVALTDRNGDVWFGTISSASRVRIHDIKSDDRTGVLRIQRVLVGKKPMYEETYHDTACPPQILEYNQNTINIEMAALCYSNSNDVRYSWFLENYDNEWVIDNEHREALYTNLPPGYYVFHAKAIEPNGYETNEVIIRFTIRRPFWQRPWFYLTEFTILGIFIFFSFRWSSNPNQNKLGSFMTLLTILIVFESLLIYLSTYINQFTNDIPVFQLVMNVILAATLNPLENFIKKIMRKWALKHARNKK